MTYDELQAVMPAPLATGFAQWSYNANYSIFQDGPSNPITGANDPVVFEGMLPRPAETLLYGDGELEKQPTLLNCPVVGCHSGGLNAAYADGHAKWLKTATSPTGTYTDLGDNTHQLELIQGGPYDGQYELLYVVMDDGSLASL